MAKINDTTTYPNTAPALTDHVPGTDVSNTANDANGETVTFTLQAIMDLIEANFGPTADIIPNADGTLDLGSTSNRWAVVHTDSIDLNGTTLSGTTLADPNADRILFWDDSAGTTAYLTPNTGLAIDGTNLNVSTGQQHLYIPAAAMVSRTTSGAAAATTELATNDVMLETMNFDTAADEFAQFSLQMPKNWDEGTLVAQFIWSHPSTTTNFDVTWAIQAVALADGDAGDTAFGTAVTVTDAGGTTDDVYISPETGAITVAGTPGAEEWVVFQVYRDVDGNGTPGNDDLAVDARLHGVKIHWTNDALTAD